MIREYISKLTIMGCMLSVVACTELNTPSGTTYTFDAPKALRIVASIDAGFAQLLTDPSVAQSLGADRVAKINAQLQVINAIQAKLAAADGSISVDVQKSWVATAESAAQAALQVASQVNSTGLLPAPASAIITALNVLSPTLEAILGSVALPDTTMTAAQAQAVIANRGEQ